MAHDVVGGTFGQPDSCTVNLQGSNDGSAFTTFLGTSNNCLSAGSATVAMAMPFQYVRVSVAALSGTGCGCSVQVQYVGYLSNPAGPPQAFGLPGMPVIEGVGGTGQFQVSTTAVYVSALNGGNLGTDACAAINYAITHAFFPGQTVVVDLEGDQPCLSNPFAPSASGVCNGNVLIGPGANYHLQTGWIPPTGSAGTSTWVIPTRCHVIFTGQGLVGGLTSASIVSACVSGDLTCGGTTFTTGGVLACFGGVAGGSSICSTGSPLGFDSVIVGGTFNCRYVSGCIGIYNNSAQENSGVFGTAIVGWGNNGIALDLESNAVNSTAEHLQLNNNQSPATCGLLDPVGIRVNGGAALTARKISDVTISGSQCQPNNGIEIEGYGVGISAIHVEKAKVAAINIGSVAGAVVASGSVTIDGVTCATDIDCVRINTSVQNVSLHGIWANSVDTNIINDLNAHAIPSSRQMVSEYVTDGNSNVHSDSSYVNLPTLGTPSSLIGGMNFANATNGNLTMLQSGTPTTGPITLTLPGAGGTLAVTPIALTAGIVPQAGTGGVLQNSSPQLDNGVTTANTLTYAGTGGFQAASFEPSPSANILISGTAPTVATGTCGTSPSIVSSNGTAAFTVNIGTAPTTLSCTINLPTAAHGWNCFAFDTTNPTSGGGFYVKQTAGGLSSATLSGYNTSGTATAWTASDVLSVSCLAR